MVATDLAESDRARLEAVGFLGLERGSFGREGFFRHEFLATDGGARVIGRLGGDLFGAGHF